MTRARSWAALVAIVASGGVTGVQVSNVNSVLRDVRPVTDDMLQEPSPDDWLHWHRTDDGWGYSPLDQINRSNVHQLQLAWSWAMDPGSQVITTPLVDDGGMYLASPSSIVHALDAATGDLLWEFRDDAELPPVRREVRAQPDGRREMPQDATPVALISRPAGPH